MIGRLQYHKLFRIPVDLAVHFFSGYTVEVGFVAEACGFVEVSRSFLSLGVVVQLGTIDFLDFCSILTVVREGNFS